MSYKVVIAQDGSVKACGPNVPEYAPHVPAGCQLVVRDTVSLVTLDPTAQIAAIEATITPRRMREAVLGTDNGWLAAVDAQIASLRSQL